MIRVNSYNFQIIIRKGGSDYESIDFDVAYDKYVKERETDESLLQKTQLRLKEWMFY